MKVMLTVIGSLLIGFVLFLVGQKAQEIFRKENTIPPVIRLFQILMIFAYIAFIIIQIISYYTGFFSILTVLSIMIIFCLLYAGCIILLIFVKSKF